jgi:hypothetical protein
MQVRGRDIILILLIITTGLTTFGCGSATRAQISRASPMPPIADTPTPTEAPALTYNSPPTEAPVLTYNSPPTTSHTELTIMHTNDTRGYTEPCG